MFKSIILVLLSTFACEIIAEENRFPSANDINQEMERIDADRKKMFANVAATKQESPAANAVDSEMERINKSRREMFKTVQPVKNNNFPNIPTPVVSSVNLDELIEKYTALSSNRFSNNLIVFSSFSVPDESWRRMVDDVNKAGGVIFLRGLKNNSIQDTATELKRLGLNGGHIAVNPKAFKQYNITAVPTVLISRANQELPLDANGCAFSEDFVSVGGDVSLAYALEYIEKSNGAFSPDAHTYLLKIGRQK